MIRENIYWLEDLVQMSSLNFYCCFEIITIIALSGALQMLCSVCFKGNRSQTSTKCPYFIFLKITLQKRNTPYQKNLSFACSILTYSRKTLHELSNVFVEHLLHDGIIKSFDPRPNSHVPDTAGLVLTIGL